jgi:hypothetical protein
LWRRPRPKLGCGAKERRRRTVISVGKVDIRETKCAGEKQSIIRVIKSMKVRWAGHVALMGEMRNSYSTLVGKPVGKRPLERSGRR